MSVEAGYAGDLSPSQAMETLASDAQAVLIDVRTKGEWDNVGVPDLGTLQGTPVFLEWLSAPDMVPNPTFVTDLSAELERRGAGKSTPLLFLCRSGARSAAAARAMATLGYARGYNIVGGFEGAPSQGRQGWKTTGLPWKLP